MLLADFTPKSQLMVPQHEVLTPRFPVIDAHNHLDTTFGGGWIHRPTAEMLDALDSVHVTHLVDLDGGWGEEILQRHLDRLAPSGRFSVFGGVDWSQWPRLGEAFPEFAARRLEQQKAWGARGLKIWKPFGLSVTDPQGRLAAVDDPRLDPIWQAAGELNLPVLVHVADPAAFFDPIDARNERWEELGQHPDWAFPSPPYPPLMEILNGFHRLVKRHPGVTFIGAHVGCYAENLAWVGRMLDDCPNYFIDISERIGELGRQPFTARRFFLRYADRILFGLDTGIDLPNYRLYFRLLETEDEYFNYNPTPTPRQGRWGAYGLALPDDVLRKVYSANAARVLRLA